MSPSKVFAIVALVLSIASSSRATELRIRLVPPPGYSTSVTVKRATLLMAWWGSAQRLPLTVDALGPSTIVRVPLDAATYRALGSDQRPEFSFIYIEPDGFAATMSERFLWLGDRVDQTSVTFSGAETTSVSEGETKEVVLPLRTTRARSLRFVDEDGRPVAGISVSVDAFWSAANHCGVPDGAERLVSEARSDNNGLVVVPDGDVEYGVALRTPHIQLIDPAPLEGEPNYFTTTALPPREQTVRVRVHRRRPLVLRVTREGRPLPGVRVAGSRSIVACMTPPVVTVEMGSTSADGNPIWRLAMFDGNPVDVKLPADARIGLPNSCE